MIFIKRTAIFITVWLFVSCQKHSATNISLKDKPLNTIKFYIQGKWKLRYAYGGYSGTRRIDYTNSYMEFKENDILYWIFSNEVLVNNKIKWLYTKDIFHDKTYIMQFETVNHVPLDYGIDGIYKDTLVLYTNASDIDRFYLTR